MFSTCKITVESAEGGLTVENHKKEKKNFAQLQKEKNM